MTEKLYGREEASELIMKAVRQCFTAARLREYETGEAELMKLDDWAWSVIRYIDTHREELEVKI